MPVAATPHPQTDFTADQWIGRLLPLHSLDDALRAIADRWSQISIGRSLCVFTTIWKDRSLWLRGVHQKGDGAPIRSVGLTLENDSDQLDVFVITERLLTSGARFEAAKLHLFQVEGASVGGLLIEDFPDGDPSIERGDLAEWRQASARLLAQAHLVEKATSARQCATDFRDAKLNSLFHFAAGAGHEINNPLGVIAGRTQLLLRNETDPDRRESLTIIGGQALRIRDMIGDLMLFAHPPVPEKEPLDLIEVLDVVSDQLSESIESSECQIQWNLSDSVPILADAVQLQVVLCCLIHNSLEAIDNQGEITIHAQSSQKEDRRMAVFEISDNGRGLSEEDREHLFDPFYSGRQAGRGIGFGLTKCWRIVTMHGGQIDVESGDRCTKFRVVWPAE